MDYEDRRVPGVNGPFGYAEQRLTLAVAIHHGWQGKEPGVLGTYSADIALADAREFLRGLEGESGSKRRRIS